MKTKQQEWEATSKRNLIHLAYWTLAWVVATALASFDPKFFWNYNATLSVIAILINAGVGVGMILMNRKYINGLDEMMKEITLNAMAIALGVGVVGGLSFSMLSLAKVISFDAEISTIVLLMGISYGIAHVIGQIRYK